jgi:outer membrane protein assembly factor BamB
VATDKVTPFVTIGTVLAEIVIWKNVNLTWCLNAKKIKGVWQFPLKNFFRQKCLTKRHFRKKI